MNKDGLSVCARECLQKERSCKHRVCRLWIDFPEEKNCSLVSIYENGPMTLRQIGDRIGLSFARVKQIETIALGKMRKNALLGE